MDTLFGNSEPTGGAITQNLRKTFSPNVRFKAPQGLKAWGARKLVILELECSQNIALTTSWLM